MSASSINNQNTALKISSDGKISNQSQFKKITFSSGITIISKLNTTKTTKTYFDIDEAPFLFSFTHSGSNRCTIKKDHYDMNSGFNGIFFLPKTSGLIENSTKTPLCVLDIIVPRKYLRKILTKELPSLPTNLCNILEKGNKRMIWSGTKSLYKSHLLSQIITPSWQSGFNILSIESKVLELVNLQLCDLIKSLNPQDIKLSKADINKLHQAKKILESQLTDSPSIIEISKKIGLNQQKFKKGFKQIFNIAPFGYQREYRLLKSHSMLQNGDKNITEITHLVGYQSPSHFSTSFKKRFGISPKNFQKTILPNTTHFNN